MTTQNQLDFNTLLQNALTQEGTLNNAYRAFHNYSLGNVMAAAWQCAQRGIELAPIASYKKWQEKGRNVKKGEKALSLCMPITMKSKQEKSDGSSEDITFSRFIWKNNWFVLSQTEGKDYEFEQVTPEWDKRLALENLGITEGSFNHHNGNVQGYASGTSIAINPLAKFPHKTRFHELAHIVLGHTKTDDMQDTETIDKSIKEVEAESVAYILCSLLELDGLPESRYYIQSWLGKNELPETSARKIFSAADKILKSGNVDNKKEMD